MGGIRIGNYQILPGAYIWIGIAAVVAVFSVVVYRNGQQAQMDDELKESAHKIQLAIERFAVDGVGEYPQKFEEVIIDGKLPGGGLGKLIELPDNPYGPGKMKLLQPGDPAEPGGFVYFHNKPITILYFGDQVIPHVSYHLYFYRQSKLGDKWYTEVPYGVDPEYVVFRLTGGIG